MRERIVTALVLAWFLAVAGGAFGLEDGNAWEALLRENPGAASDPTIGPFERRLLRALTPEQAESWLAGADPATILLAEGGDLASLITSTLEEDTATPGLVFHPLPACTVVSTALERSAAGAPLDGQKERSYGLRGIARDLELQGGSRSGCGVPEDAEAVFVNVELVDSSGSGTLLVYESGNTPAGSGVLQLGSGKHNGTAIVQLCRGCRSGELTLGLRSEDAGEAHVQLDVLGYFVPFAQRTTRPQRTAAAAVGTTSAANGDIGDIGEPIAPPAVAPQTAAASEALGITGEIKIFAGNFDPEGWLRCDGRLLAIRDHLALFEVVGNAYGGDGRTTFGLPDLRGRVPMGAGAGPGLTNRRLGQEPGSEAVILDVTQLPSHTHTLRATNSSATQTQPAGNVLATAATPQYLNSTTSVVMGAGSIGATGSNAPHSVVQPSSVLNFLIAEGPRLNSLDKGLYDLFPLCQPDSSPVRLVGPLQFTSGGVDYFALKEIEHEDGIGTIWYAVPVNHDLEVGPVTPLIVLNPDVITPYGGCSFLTTRPPDPDALGAEQSEGGIDPKAVRLDRHSGLQFTSGGVDYLGLQLLVQVDGVGTIWLAIPKNHDLETGPVTPLIVLNPDVATPV